MKLRNTLDDAIVGRMARDLVRLDAWRSEADAIRSLMNRGGYTTTDIALLVDDARRQAFTLARCLHQPIVAGRA